jgi:hypothetical protein
VYDWTTLKANADYRLTKGQVPEAVER